MKKWVVRFALLSLVVGAPAFGQLNQDDYSAQMILTEQAGQEEEGKPFSSSANFEVTGRAKFEHEHHKPHLKDIQYGNAYIDASAVFYYNACCKEGLLATAGYTYTRIDWCNPYFKQNHFNTVNFAIAGFTDRACNWTWKGQVQANADLIGFEWSSYFSFDIILFGRYSYSECLGLDVGFIALTGMKIDRLYPIIGFDWQINDCWKLNVIYPTNISLVYSFTPEWSVEVATRSYDVRHRTDEDQKHNYSRGLIEYRAIGAEFGIGYKMCDGNVSANLHAGEILGGKIKVSDQHHKHSHRYRFKTAPYVGGEAVVRF